MNEEFLEHRLKKLEERADKHSTRLDRLENSQAEFKVQIQNLCNDIQSLTSILKWLIGVFLTSFLGFFVYAVQQGVFK